MGLDDEDSLAVIARVPRDELGDDEEAANPGPADGSTPEIAANSESSGSPVSAGGDEGDASSAEAKPETTDSGDSTESDSESE